MKPVGRPTDCTPELTRAVAKAVGTGMSIRGACALAGMGERTYYDWLERGETGEEPFAHFSRTCKRARASGERKLVRALDTSDKGDAGRIFLLKASHGYRDSEPVQVIQNAPTSGPAPNTPEWEAALIDMLAAKPDLLEKAAAKAKEKR